METTNITITAANPIELASKKQAIETIANQSAEVLKRLEELAKNPKAQAYLTSPTKFAKLKLFL